MSEVLYFGIMLTARATNILPIHILVMYSLIYTQDELFLVMLLHSRLLGREGQNQRELHYPILVADEHISILLLDEVLQTIPLGLSSLARLEQ